MNLKELAWAAGFFDGEGSFSARLREERGGTRSSISASVPQVRMEPLVRFHKAVLGIGQLHIRRELSRQVAPINVWSSQNWRDVQTVAALLWSFLTVVKRDQYKRALGIYRSVLWGQPVGRPFGAKDLKVRKQRLT